MTFLLMLPNFNPLRRLEVFFFSFLFEISRPPLLGLVPEVKAQITGSDVIGSTRKIPHGYFLKGFYFINCILLLFSSQQQKTVYEVESI